MAPPEHTPEQAQQLAKVDRRVNTLVEQVASEHHGRMVRNKEIMDPKYYLYLVVDESDEPVIMSTDNLKDLKEAYLNKWPVIEFDYQTDLKATLQGVALARNP